MSEATIDQAFQIALKHHEAGQLPQAEKLYRQILAQQPKHPGALHYLGVMSSQFGRNNIAVDLIQQAISLQPDYAEAYSNLGAILKDMGQLDAAVSAYLKALALKPQYVEAYNNLGNAQLEKGQPDEAIAAYHEALALRPNYVIAHSNLIYTMHFHPGHDARTIAEEECRWSRQHAQPLKEFIKPHLNDRNPQRRLRIGFVSSDFQSHASAYFLIPLLEYHDPQQVEVFCYAQVVQPDGITRRMHQRAAAWRSTVGLSDAQVADQIRQDRIDILVDLKLHTTDNRLLIFARKPAPVQVTWLGYPGSTGLQTIDYRLSDAYLDPPGMDESIYSERTIRLPDCFWCYNPLDERQLPVNSLPAFAHRFLTFGCLSKVCKINDTMLGLWARILSHVEGSRLLLLSNTGSHMQRIADALLQHGIDPGRLEFVPRQSRRSYLELYHRIDMILDTLPYNGHTTSLDSLWMGVPLVSLAGKTAVGRAGLSILSNVGLPELIAHSEEDYVRLAIELARDLPRLSNIRSTLRQQMEQSPLMDALRFARNVEAVYRQIWRVWCAQAPVLR